jgi:type IV pilus assembly protein PilO
MKFGIRELLFVILLMAIPTGAYYWVYRPTNEYIRKQQKEIEIKTQKLAKLQKAMLGIEDLNSEVKKLKEAVDFFEDKLPPQHEIHKVLEQVTRIAEAHRLETKLFQTQKPTPFAKYSEQPIKMELHGDFDSMYQFLLDMEKMPRITRIVKMEFKKNEKVEGMVQANFQLSIFFDNSDSKKS